MSMDLMGQMAELLLNTACRWYIHRTNNSFYLLKNLSLN